MEKARQRNSERGSAVMIVTMWLVLLLFLGMAVDYGIILRYRRAMQNGCDTGALAGAHDLTTSPSTAAQTAQTFASRDLSQNNIASDNSTPTAVALNSSGQPSTPYDRVKVNIHATVPTYFYRLVRNSVPVAVECTARIEPTSSVTGLAPAGEDNTQWSNFMTSYIAANPGCGNTVPISQRPANCPTVDLFSKLGDVFGSGNTGKICVPGGDTNCGESVWRDEFANGTSASYCVDFNHSATVPDPSPSPSNANSCSLVETKPGNLNKKDVQNGVSTRCAMPAPPASNAQILEIPLANPSGKGGRSTLQIWGFVGFQIDCAHASSWNDGTQVQGWFVTTVTYQATGCDPAKQANCVNNGVETVVLSE